MTKKIWFSIKTKFVLITVLIVALFSLMLGTGAIRMEEKHLRDNLTNQGRVLMTALKAPIINSMILDEMGISPSLLDNYVDEIFGSSDLPTVYAFITDQHGRVLAHNRNSEFGKIYRDPLTLAALNGDGYLSAFTGDREGKRVLDLALPLRVEGKCWGSLRVGLSTAPMEAEFQALKERVVEFVALAFLVCCGVFYVVGYTMSRPLERLSRSMESVELGLFEAPTLPKRRDEIGQLQESFNSMLARLDHSEQERQKALNCLIQNEKMISIGRIVAGVAHEINNPLAAMSACVFKMERKVPESARNCMEILKASIPRIGSIVKQLSDFSRVRDLELGEVKSNLFFDEVRSFAVMAFEEHEVMLIAVDGCHPVQTLAIDKARMHQVVLNLLLNAAAASGYKGLIELRTGAADGWYSLTVRDRGHGIPVEEQDKIFDIFYSTRPAGEGSGIGLAVCKNIVELHGGVISVASVPGDTSFNVRIPLHRGRDHA